MTHPLTLNVPDQVFGPLSEAARQAGTSPETVAVAWLTAASRQAPCDRKGPSLIDELLAAPLRINGFHPLTREETHAR